MLDKYLPLNFDLDGQSVKGFCMRINDEFFETYAVILEGYESFSVWIDESKKCWKSSKYVSIEPKILERIYFSLQRKLHIS